MNLTDQIKELLKFMDFLVEVGEYIFSNRAEMSWGTYSEFKETNKATFFLSLDARLQPLGDSYHSSFYQESGEIFIKISRFKSKINGSQHDKKWVYIVNCETFDDCDSENISMKNIYDTFGDDISVENRNQLLELSEVEMVLRYGRNPIPREMKNIIFLNQYLEEE